MQKESTPLFKYLALVFTFLSVIIVFYFAIRIALGLDELFPLGEALVNREWPSPDSSIIYAKPVTYLAFFTLMAWLFGLEALKDKFMKCSEFWIRVFMIVSTIIAFFSGYEVLWNFSMWAAFFSSNPDENPDTMVNIYPNPRYPVNFVFATKMFTVAFFASLYFLLYLLIITWKRERL